MNFAEAQKLARKMFGKGAHLSMNEKALTEDEKAPLRDELANLKAQKEELQKQMVPIIDRMRALQGKLLGTRRRIGKISGVGGVGFFNVEGSGDTWADCFKQIEARRTREQAERDQALTEQQQPVGVP